MVAWRLLSRSTARRFKSLLSKMHTQKQFSALAVGVAVAAVASASASAASSTPAAFGLPPASPSSSFRKRQRTSTALFDSEQTEPPLYVQNDGSDATQQQQHMLSLEATAGFTCPVGADETRFSGAAPSLAIDPKQLELVPRCDSLDDAEQEEDSCLLVDTDHTRYPFVQMIRGSSPYIATHRGELAVIHIPGDLLAWDGFVDLVDDIALCWLLGMKIVIVVGCRHQVDCRGEEGEKRAKAHIRVTDKNTLRVVEEEAGYVRFEIERQLNRCLRLHGGGEVSSTPNAPNGNVISGNFFSSKPFGVIDGVDYQYTGRPHHLNVKRVVDLLQNGDIVLLTPVGIGPTGEGLNVNSESLAAFVAASLCANKVVYCSNDGMILQDSTTKKRVQNFRVRDSLEMLDHFQVKVHKNYFLTVGQDTQRMNSKEIAMLLKIGWATQALNDGVERAHIIAPTNGALIEELFTAKEGTGTCISHDTYESIHPDDDSGDNEMSNRDYREAFVAALAESNEPEWPKTIPIDFERR